jgi:predicted secreted protein
VFYNTSLYNYTQFEKPSAEFTGVYSDYGTDTDANGVYDYLTTEIEVNVSNPGNYTLLGWLSDNKRSDIIWANNHTYLGIGTHSVLLNFDGTAVYKHGIDGPYNLSYLTLHDENDTPIDLVYAAYNTSAYSYTDFQSPSASFRDTYSDYGVDTNGDGFYEYLTVEVGLDITSAGNYSTHGCLYDIYGNETADTYNLTYLNTGNQIVTLNFGGNSIYKHGVNGSFNLTHLLLYDENGTLVDNMYYAYTTSAYGYTDFQPLIRLTGSYLDYGTDTDDNGLFDNLTVDVGVMLASEGHCIATARLVDSNGEEIVWASNTSWLYADQSQVIQLNFDGKSIYGNMVDGPYYVRDVYVYHTGDPTLSDYVYGAYTTAAYNYTDFEKSGILYYPDFTDTDTPGNWRTWLGVMNTGDTAITVRLDVYNPDGNLAYSNPNFVTLESKAVHFFRPGITAGIGQGSAIVYGDTIAGTCHVNTNGGEGTKVYTALSNASSTLYYPDFTDTDTAGNWRTWIAVMNTEDTSTTLNLTIYNTDGSIAYSNSDFVTLEPKAVHFFRPGITAGIGQGSVAVSGDNLAGTCHVNKNGGEGTKVYTALTSGSSTLYYPDFTDTDTAGNWRTWLGVMNTGDTSATLRLDVYNTDGSLAYSNSDFVTLDPKAVHFFRPGMTAGIAQGSAIVSGNNLAGTCHVNKNGGEGTKVYTALSSGSSTLNYPDFTDTDTSGNWRTWLGVVNTGDTSTTVRLNVYNPDGSLAYSDTEFVTLGPKAVHFFRPGITAGIAQGDVVVSGDNLAGTCHVNRNGGEGTKVYTAIGG